MSEKKDCCGVIGIFGHPDAVEKVYLGLYALQHRGQESAGIASTDGKQIKCYAHMGLVRDALTPSKRRWLKNDIAIGHVRYSTTGSSAQQNAQPIVAEYSRGQIAIAHNGNLTNAGLLRDEYEAYGSIFHTTSDTEVIIHLMAKPTHVAKPDTIAHVMSHLEGAFSLVMLTTEEMLAVRDPHGMRPLCLGKCDGAYVVASESCALNLIGAKYEREIYPGEVLRISGRGRLQSELFCDRSKVIPAHCIFEHIYIGRPDSIVFGEAVHSVRMKLGR
ncbi:MAG: class II glutamine amidotransferase, partial [Phycisphaerae bacterium]|nr:class II glutamine amidotransferase [Phycisphaerae bacterium]